MSEASRQSVSVLIRHRHRRADDERAMQPEGGDAIGGGEFPIREVALHNLKSWRDPLDARERERTDPPWAAPAP